MSRLPESAEMSPPLIDVEQLVDDIRERVEARRRAGQKGRRTFGRERTALRPGGVVLRPEVTTSDRRALGPALSAVKRVQLRLAWPFLADVVLQVNAALDTLRQTIAAESRRRAQLEQRIAELENRLRDGETATSDADGRRS